MPVAYHRWLRLHLIGAAFRSVETHRPQLSAVIDAAGTLVASLDTAARGTLVGVVRPDAHPASLVVVWGEWLGPLARAAGVALVAAGRAARR